MDDSESDLSNEWMRSFSEYDGEEENIFVLNVSQEKKCTNPATNLVNGILLDRAKYNTSYAACTAVSDKINSVPGNELKIPTRKEQLK